MHAPRCFALSTVVALCVAVNAPLAVANSSQSVPGSPLQSIHPAQSITYKTLPHFNQKKVAVTRNQTLIPTLQVVLHRTPMASAIATQQLTGKLDPHACGDPAGNCESSLLNIGRRIANYPEPVALSLFGTSLLGIAGVARRRFTR
jgi:hypothetical protein